MAVSSTFCKALEEINILYMNINFVKIWTQCYFYKVTENRRDSI